MKLFFWDEQWLTLWLWHGLYVPCPWILPVAPKEGSHILLILWEPELFKELTCKLARLFLSSWPKLPDQFPNALPMLPLRNFSTICISPFFFFPFQGTAQRLCLYLYLCSESTPGTAMGTICDVGDWTCKASALLTVLSLQTQACHSFVKLFKFILPMFHFYLLVIFISCLYKTAVI